jgi:hypothetical protein
MSSFGVSLPIGGDLSDEVRRRLRDVRKDNRQAEVARPQGTFWIATDAEPDWELVCRSR